MRIYLPATIRSLQTLHDQGALAVGDDVVVPGGDSEDEEYAALMAAAAASAAVLASELTPGERRRVVVVAETSSTPQTPSRIALADVVAIHADPEDLPELGADPEDDLGWYATQELGDLVRSRRPPRDGN